MLGARTTPSTTNGADHELDRPPLRPGRRRPRRRSCLAEAEDCRLSDLLAVLDEQTRLEDYPHASRVEQQVLVYDSTAVRPGWPTGRGAARSRPRSRGRSRAARASSSSPGLRRRERARPHDRGLQPDDRRPAQPRRRGRRPLRQAGSQRPGLERPREAGGHRPRGLRRLLRQRRGAGSHRLAGPGQVTSQVNVVNPGGEGQTVHRDYHLGFQSDEVCADYPAHVRPPRC